MQEYKLTVIVPLKDNPNRTLHFLRNHADFYPEIQFLIADGSIGSENQEIFQTVTLQNMHYVRFEADISLNNYANKMLLASRMANSEYILTLDAGDYLNQHVISRILKNTNGEKVISSDQYMVNILGNYASAPYKIFSIPQSGLQTDFYLEKLKSEYYYFWYSIFESEVYVNIWEFLVNHKMKHPYLEFFPTLAALDVGFTKSNEIFLMRVKDSPRVRTDRKGDFTVVDGIDNWRNELRSFANFAEKALTKFDADRIYTAFYSNTEYVANVERREYLYYTKRRFFQKNKEKIEYSYLKENLYRWAAYSIRWFYSNYSRTPLIFTLRKGINAVSLFSRLKV